MGCLLKVFLYMEDFLKSGIVKSLKSLPLSDFSDLFWSHSRHSEEGFPSYGCQVWTPQKKREP